MIRANFLLAVCCVFGALRAPAENNDRLQGVWHPNKELSLSASAPLIEKLPKGRESDFLSFFAVERYSFSGDRVTVEDLDNERMETKRYRILAQERSDVTIEVFHEFPHARSSVIKFGFIGPDRIWVRGSIGHLVFYDRKPSH